MEGIRRVIRERPSDPNRDRKSTRLNSSHTVISYAVFCLKKKKQPDKPADDASGDCDTHDCDFEADGPEECPRGGHDARNRLPTELHPRPAAALTTDRTQA